MFLALDDAIQNFHNPELQNKKLSELFHLYCSYAPPSSKLSVQSCWKAFNQALYNTLRILFTGTGNVLTAETQFAWRCFTNDLNTPDIIGAYESRRPSNIFDFIFFSIFQQKSIVFSQVLVEIQLELVEHQELERLVQQEVRQRQENVELVEKIKQAMKKQQENNHHNYRVPHRFQKLKVKRKTRRFISNRKKN